MFEKQCCMLRSFTIFPVLLLQLFFFLLEFSSTARVLCSFRIRRKGHAGYQRPAIYDCVPYDDKGEPSAHGEDTFN